MMVRTRRSTQAEDPGDFAALMEGFEQAYLGQEGQQLLKQRPELDDALRLFKHLCQIPDREAVLRGEHGAQLRGSLKALAKGLDALVEKWLGIQGDLNLSAEERKNAAAQTDAAILTRITADNLPDPTTLAMLDGVSNAHGLIGISGKYRRIQKQRNEQDKLSLASRIEVAGMSRED